MERLQRIRVTALEYTVARIYAQRIFHHQTVALFGFVLTSLDNHQELDHANVRFELARNAYQARFPPSTAEDKALSKNSESCPPIAYAKPGEQDAHDGRALGRI